MGDRAITIAAAARPRPGEDLGGDTWGVDWHDDACRIVVVDGLGHGPGAAAVAQRARETLASQPELNPAEALHACHRALSGTRGAAISVALVDLSTRRLTYAGVGNVEARLWQSGQQQRLLSYRGIVGSATPTIRSFDFPLSRDWLLLMHTDGISARFELSDLTDRSQEALQAFANGLLQQWARPTDDATVLIACSAAPAD